MSQSYPQRNNKEIALLRALEGSVKQLADDFQGQRAFNFYHESELAAYLLVQLRDNNNTQEYINDQCMYLAHLEWPCIERRRIDLVIWQPGTLKRALELWRGRANCARQLPLLAAIQIKRGPGKITSWSETQKDTNDLEKLYSQENFNKPVLYFLEYVDHGIKHKNDLEAYQDIQIRLENWCSETENRRACVITRDGFGFALPKGAWLTDPLHSRK